MELYEVERLRKMTYAAVFAALTGAGALLSIPLPLTPVPMTLQTFFIMLAGYVLGARWGGVSILLYLLLGAAGLPVFSGGSAGAGHLLGPTAGFLWSFPVAAFVVGAFAEAGDGRPGAQRLGFKVAGAVAGSVVIYALGTVQLMNFFEMGVWQALAVGVVPFVPSAAVEVAAAIGASESLNRADVVSASTGPEVRGRDERAVYGGLLGVSLAFSSVIPWSHISTVREVVEDGETVEYTLGAGVSGVQLSDVVDLVHEEGAVAPETVEISALAPYGFGVVALGLASVGVAVLVARGFDERKAAAGYGGAGVLALAVAAAGYLEVTGWTVDASVSVGYGVYLAALAGGALMAFAAYCYHETTDDGAGAADQ